jgi:hypothetical protein
VHIHDALDLVIIDTAPEFCNYYTISMGYIANSHCAVYGIAVVLPHATANAHSNGSRNFGQAIDF